MQSTMHLPFDGGVIREYRDPQDIEALVRHADNPRVTAHLRDAFPQPYTHEAARRWLASCAAEEPPVSFAIALPPANPGDTAGNVAGDQAGELIGGIGLIPQQDVFRLSAEVGYWLGEAHWGRGIATRAVTAFCRWAFAERDLVRLYAGVFETNTASVRVLEKAGFVFEGRLRKAVIKDGRLLDDLLFGLTADDLADRLDA